jgi:hypothetical protein
VPGLERTIDLAPATLARVERRGSDVAVHFPSQPSYTDASGDAPRIVPLFRCELLIEAAQIESIPDRLPLESDDWSLRYRGGTRASFLPVPFEAEGPIELTFGSAQNSKVVVSGKRVRFDALEQVGTEEQWPAT